MKISQYMKHEVVSILETSTVREAATVFVKEHVGLLPIIDEDKTLIGVIGLHKLLSLVLPDFVNFVDDVDFILKSRLSMTESSTSVSSAFISRL
jgi:predicted transcriptional regulator